MRHSDAPCPSRLFGPLRWQLGLLLLSLPRRLIPGCFGNLSPGGFDDPLPEPVGHAHACQGRRLPYQGVVLWQDTTRAGRGPSLPGRAPSPLGRDPPQAERLFQAALELARRQGARLLELRAALSLGRLWHRQGRIEAARELVAQARQGFTGELASRDLQEARVFLDSCSTEEE